MVLSTPGRIRGPENEQAAAPAGLAGLGNRFVELFGRKLSRRSFAAETARLIVAAVRIRAVAILGYDRRQDRLTLLAENGLRPEARMVLGGGADCTWDIPMRGLRNRRISVVEAAHQNPFVPPSLIELAPGGLCIASVPLYYDFEPVGVVLLFAAGSRAFPDAHLQTLSQALRVCARGLRDSSGPAVRPAPALRRDDSTDARPVSAGEATAAGAVTPQPATDAAQQVVAELAAKVQRLESELRQAQDEVERSAQAARSLTASANAAARERDNAVQQLADVQRAREVEVTELRAGSAALEDRLLAVDSERARYQRIAEARSAATTQSIQKLESERDALSERVSSAEGSAAALQTQLTAEHAERERLAAHVELLTAQVRAGAEALERAQARYAQERGTTEADRDAWKEQAAAVRAQLAERSETLGELDRELRGTVIARDSAASQLQAARAEIDRLAALDEELSVRATQLETARVAALAEAGTLQRALEEERGKRQHIEEALRTELTVARQEAERMAAEGAALAAELAERRRGAVERDEQLASLRAEHEDARRTLAESQHANAALRAEAATLTAQLEQGGAERQQLLDERAALRAALSDARQRANQADVAHAATLGQAQAEAVELRRQVDGLSADRSALSDRLQRALEEGRDLTVRLAEAQRRSGDLHELLRQRDDALDRLASEREALAAQVATAAGQLQAAQDAVERIRAGAAQERKALETQRDEWQEQVAAAREELQQRAERLAAVEHDLRSASVARDAATTELHTARAESDRLAVLVDELRHTHTRLDAERAAGATESAALRMALDEERTARVETERALRGELVAARIETERLSAALTARQDELRAGTSLLGERDTQIAGLLREIEALRQQSTDRGVLARQASELGSKVVELEQALVAARGDAARAERQRAALDERLAAARRREAEAIAAAHEERSALQEAVQRVTDERGRAEADTATLRGEIDGLRSTLTDLQTALEAARAERTRAIEETSATTQLLSAAEQRVQQAAGILEEREAALAAATQESQRLAAQLAAATAQVEIGREALDAARVATAEERDAIAVDRDTWKQQAVAARADVERLAARRDELQRQAAQVMGEHGALVAELEALRRGAEEERAANRHAADVLGTDLSRARADVDRLNAEATTLRAELAERDTQIEALRQRDEAARQVAGQWQQEQVAVRDEIAALTARLDERAAECQQLREGRAALEHQLALVTATQGEAEQALAHGLDAARAQIAQLEEERAALTVTLAETRQRLSHAEAAQDAAAAQLEAETARLQRQVQSLTGARSKQAKRLEEAERTLKEHAARFEEERRRAHDLAERSAQLEQSLAAAEAHGAALDAQLLQACAEVSTLTTRLEDSVTAAQAQRDERAALESELTRAAASRDEQHQAVIQQLHAAQGRVAELEQTSTTLQATLADTQRRLAESDSAHGRTRDQHRAEGVALREQLERLTAERDTLSARLQQNQLAHVDQTRLVEESGRRAAKLEEHSAQLDQALRSAEERRASLEAQLAHASAEIEALRQQSDDRGVLAHQASELGRTVVELEQQLAAQRGDVARAERERAAVIEELEEAKRSHAEADAAAEQRHAAYQEMIEHLTNEQRRLEGENAARQADADALRALLADERAASEGLRTERARAQEEGQDATHRLSEMHRRFEELSGALAHRDAAVEAAVTERQRLTAQVTKLTSQLRAAQEALETAQGRSALERAAAESDRDTAKAQAVAARAEVERLSALTRELHDAVTELEAGRSTAATEGAALRRTLDEARANHRQTEAALRDALSTAQIELERLSTDSVAQREAIAERDEQVAALRGVQEAARARDAEWQQTTGALRGELAALTAQLRESGVERQQLHDARELLEAELTAAAAARSREEQTLLAARDHIRQLEEERAALRDALDGTRQQIAQAHAAQAAALEEVRSEAVELRKQLTAALGERTALSERLRRVERAATEQAAQADRDRQHAATLVDRCAQLEQTLATAEARRTGLDGELANARAEVDALRQQSADRGALAHQTSELGSQVRQLAEQLAAQQADAGRIERQRAALEDQLRAAREHQEAAASAAQLEEMALRDLLARSQEERRQLDVERAERARVTDALRAQVAEMRTALDELTTERERAHQEGQEVAGRLSEAQQRVEKLQGLLQERDALIQAAAVERAGLVDASRMADSAAADLLNERDELRRKLTELSNRLEQERAAHTEEKAVLARDMATQFEGQPPTAKSDAPEVASTVPPDGADDAVPLYQGPLAIERSAPLGAVVEGTPDPLDAPDAPAVAVARPHKGVLPSGELVLLDEGALRDDACAALKGAGFEVAAFPPTESGVDEMLRRKVKCVMLNLGSGVAAWHTLRVLRERVGSRNLPILAYIMSKDVRAGFCFGRADFAIWPMDGARLIERLGRLRPKLKRLLALSADVDGMGRMREPLAQAKISTSIVLDGKQALEFAAMVDPEAAILQLSPNCPSVSRALAGLRTTEATRDLPLLLLLDKAPAPREDAFFTATTVQLLSKPAFQFTNLPEEIARVIG